MHFYTIKSQVSEINNLYIIFYLFQFHLLYRILRSLLMYNMIRI